MNLARKRVLANGRYRRSLDWNDSRRPGAPKPDGEAVVGPAGGAVRATAGPPIE